MSVPELRPFLQRFNTNLVDSESTDFLVKAIESAIRERKGREEQFNDFVSLLLKAEITDESVQSPEGRVRGMTSEEMISQALIFMVAGYETTASALTFAAFLLAQHPECQERCRAEVMTEFSDISPVRRGCGPVVT